MVVALVATALIAVASVALGARAVGWHDIVAGVGGDASTIAQAAVEKRVPRTILALLVGGSLGLAGAVMQGVTRNPLADPGILGVTTGASLAVVICMAYAGLTDPTLTIWVAILGAAVAAGFVYTVGSLGRGGATPLKLTLAGAATSAALTSLISAVLLPRAEVLNQFRFWQIGGVGGASYSRIGQVLPFLIVGALLCLAAVGAIALCGAATAVAGPIAFVGLVVPHLCRLLIGIDHRWLLPASTVVGAALLAAADVVGRVVGRPAEIEVGIITAFIGAPVFIYIVRRQKVRAL